MHGFVFTPDFGKAVRRGPTAVCRRQDRLVREGAGAAFPYGKDPKDSNIRIAPTMPTLDELKEALELFVICVKLVAVEKLLEA